MRKLLVGFAGLIVLLVAAALIAPGFIDWNGYKGRITAAIEDATGLSLAIDGDIALAILPSPMFAVSGLRVVGAGERKLLRVGELRVRVGVAGLLERRIEVASVTLVEPVISLQVGEDGSSNWELSLLSGDDGGGQAATTDSSGSTGSDFDISLTNLRIEDGSIHYRDAAGGIEERVEDIEAMVSAASMDGPFTVDANVTLRGQRLAITLNTGRIEPDQPISLELSVETAEPRTAVQFGGTLSELTDIGRLEGKLRISGANAGLLLAKHTTITPSQLLLGDYSLEASISAARDGIALNDASIQHGETRATGAIFARFGDQIQADIAINIASLNLDALLRKASAAPASTSDSASSTAAGSNSAASEQGSGDQVAAEQLFELPANLHVSLDLQAQVVQFRSGIIREAILRAILSNGSIAVEQASALLPGASDVTLSGFVQPVEGKPQFDGELTVTSDNLRGIFDWLEIAPGSLPPDRLRNFSYVSQLKATPEALELTDFKVELDASKVTGGLAVAFRERPAFGLRVDIDKLNLDPYLQRPAAGGKQAKTPSSSEGQQPAAVASASDASADLGPLAILNDFDANIDARVERLSVRDMVVEKLHVDMSLVGGKLTLHEASVGGIAGVTARISGEVDGIAKRPTAALAFSASSRDVEKLGRVVGVEFRLPRGTKRSVAVNGQLNGGLSDMTVEVTVDLLGAKVGLDGKFKDILVNPTYDIGLTLDHPDLADAMRLVAPDYKPAATNLGPLAISLRAAGTLASVRLTELTGNAGPIALRGNASVELGGSRPNIKAELATSEILLDLLLPVADPSPARSSRRQSAAASAASGTKSATAAKKGAPPSAGLFPNVDVELTGRMAALTMSRIQLEDPQFHLLLKDGKLNIDRFTAKAFGGSLASAITIDGNHVDPRIASSVVATDVQLRTLMNAFGDFDRAEGAISTNVEFTAEGLSQEQMIATLNGKGSVSGKVRVLATEEEKAAVAAGSLIGALLGSRVREIRPFTDIVSVLVESFGSRFATLSGDYTIANGVVRTEAAVLDGGSARAVTRGSADLPAWKINSVTAVYKGEGTEPFVTATLTGPLDAPDIKFGGNALKPGGAATQVNPLEKLLPGLLGGTKPQSTENPQSGQSQQKLKPEDLLKSLLKGFGGG